ncbi:MAG: hypothetical protein LBG88_04545 [Christensenellaceae bacterium]|jgi:hypothetical protein|nr:hypothetical protein [Christensenellaceae bacterium]
MIRKLTKIATLALCLISISVCATVLTGCGSKQIKITADDISIYSFDENWDKSAALPTAMHEETIKIDVASDTIDVEFDFAKFFETNPEFLGKNFYFTRDDLKKGDGTLIKGYGWTEVEPGNATTRKYKKMGYEDKEEIEAMSKDEIQDLKAHEGEARMYFLSDGGIVTYIDATTGSNLESGETNVTFRIHGNHGRVALMKVLVNKS